jgi:hypothetical protein
MVLLKLKVKIGECNMKEIIRNIKPPLGVMPFNIFKEKLYSEQMDIELKMKLARVKKISKSISDYAKDYRSIDVKWVNEYNDIINTLVGFSLIKEAQNDK